MDQFTATQVAKLFKGKVLLILDEDDLESFILATVPALELEAQELATGTLLDQVQAEHLHLLAKELRSIPVNQLPALLDLSTNLH